MYSRHKSLWRKVSNLNIMTSLLLGKLKRRPVPEPTARPKKKIDRFDGVPEEEVQKNTLPDILDKNLDMVFVGINPGLMSAHCGRYYAGPGNHFYKLLHESKLTPRLFSHEEDSKLPQYGIGLTNIVPRATRSSSDLKRAEIKEGARLLEQKLRFFNPKIAIFNGKGIYEVYANKTSKSEFHFGLQLEKIGETAVWVVPSSSARCAHFPRMVDKLRFYLALSRFLLHAKGELLEVDAGEFLFEGKCKQSVPTTSRMWRRKNLSAFAFGGRVANKNTIEMDTSGDMVAIVNSSEFVVNQTKVPEDSTETIENSVLIESQNAEMSNDLLRVDSGFSQSSELDVADSKDIEQDSQQEEDEESSKIGRKKLQIEQKKDTNLAAFNNMEFNVNRMEDVGESILTNMNPDEDWNIEAKIENAKILGNSFLMESKNTGMKNNSLENNQKLDSKHIERESQKEDHNDSSEIARGKLLIKQKKEDVSEVRKNSLKRPKLDEKDQTSDFISLIKQRISEKNSGGVVDEMRKEKNPKKLKYTNLKANRGTAKFCEEKSTSEEK